VKLFLGVSSIVIVLPRKSTVLPASGKSRAVAGDRRAGCAVEDLRNSRPTMPPPPTTVMLKAFTGDSGMGM